MLKWCHFVIISIKVYIPLSAQGWYERSYIGLCNCVSVSVQSDFCSTSYDILCLRYDEAIYIHGLGKITESAAGRLTGTLTLEAHQHF